MKTNYTQLTADLQRWLEDDDAEFVLSIPEIISLGEVRLARDLDLAMFTGEEVVAITTGDSIVAKPSVDAVSYRSIGYFNGGQWRWLELRSDDFVRDYLGGPQGLPKVYSEYSEDEWRIAPETSEDLSLFVRYTRRPEGLGPTNENTWLATNVGDGLFKACLAEAEKFLKSDDRVPVWEQDYAGLLPEIKRETYQLMAAQFPRFNMTPAPGPQR